MAKTVVMFVLAGLVLLSVGVWLVTSPATGNKQEEIFMVLSVFLLVGFAVFRGFGRVRSLSRKEPYEDELTKNIMTKSSSLAYYVSLYLWLFVMYISDRSELASHTLIGAGIACMALIFLGSWIWVKFYGLKHD